MVPDYESKLYSILEDSMVRVCVCPFLAFKKTDRKICEKMLCGGRPHVIHESMSQSG